MDCQGGWSTVSLSLPWLNHDNSFWGSSSHSEGSSLLICHQGFPRMTPRITSAQGAIPHPRGGTEHSSLYIIWGLGHDDTYHWSPKNHKNSPPPPPPLLDLQRRNRPLHRLTALTRPHPSLQWDCKHHLTGLLSPHWPTGHQVVFWLCQFKPLFLYYCLYWNFPIKL